VDCATEWLDLTMYILLNIYGLQKCVREFGDISADMPREERKVHPDSFILEYISTLHRGENLNRERGGKERSPPDNRVTKRRVLVVYGEGDSNAWNTPLMDSITDTIKNLSSKDYSKESIDLKKDDTDTSASNETISQLSQDLAFLRKDFNDYIQLTNKNPNEENTSF